MAAADLPTLYKFENEFESAAVTFLNTATGITVNSTVTDDDLTVPRIEVRFDVGEALDPPDKRGGGASPNTVEYRAYNATFTAFVITDNAVGQADDHATYRAKVRQALMLSASNWDATTLPYYDLKYLRPSGESYSTDGDFNITEMTFAVVFEIRDDAWPTS